MPPKLAFWEIWPPNRGCISTKPPKGTSLGRKRSYDIYTVKIDLQVQPMCVTKRPKKRKTKKETWQWQTGYSPRPPTSSDRNEILHGGWSLGGSSKVRIHSTSVKRFRSCWGSKFVHSQWLGHWLIQQLVLAYKPWCTSCVSKGMRAVKLCTNKIDWFLTAGAG